MHSVVMSVQTTESYFHSSGLAITTRWENFSIDLIGIFRLQLIGSSSFADHFHGLSVIVNV